MIKLAINGFGRIGRAAFKIALEREDIEIVALNDLTDNETLAHLLKYDTVYGTYPKEIKGTEEGIKVDGNLFRVWEEKEPEKLPWKDLGVDVVLECTGKFRKVEDAELHLKAGAKQVILSAPAKGEGVNSFVIGVNDEEFDSQKDKIVSNASCTTNSVAPVMKVLNEAFGVKKAMLTTIHSYTADQNLIDGPHKDLRRARAAAQNIVPTSTGAAKATGETIPDLKGKFDGMAVRVPTIDVSLSDLTVLLNKEVTEEEVNKEFKKAAKNSRYKGILAVTEEPLVSSDFIKNNHSTIVDLSLTKVVDKDLLKVIAWYDNEWGYACRLVELAEKLGKKGK
ncbi:MAG: type I glyceraldehyde-3-phosphate dehydrogenase [Candidatus Kerfeldbacteria bacterium CG08_land_8_20_14_0_20_40_16]|uniref:Type I glyceraldehyde-3-phosphate dehydrogenase n=1 Tax=Candidatus Kerfeldbacteria bacterium CG08_land_8_20_14_0_20_40_16 TaxID=2014244 RepID=A0A2H0YWG5_9BACT|nr:MAG: type I glyceraldehyde-3-phosphate dehydrogenase [Candidatus Kerfeldbacteria bacterium CG08_land_8_20_14_0_20_40_16]